MFDFVCVGDATIDNFYFIDEASVRCDRNERNCTLDLKYGQKIPVKNFAQSLGGNAANVSVGLARLGVKTALVTTFGNDDRGGKIKRVLGENNVNLEFCATDEKRESNSSDIIVFGGERTILTYHAAGEDLTKEIPESKWVYLTSSAGRDSAPIFEKVLQVNSKLAFNPSMEDIKKNTEVFRKVLEKKDVLLVNKEENEAIGQTKTEILAVTDGNNGATGTIKGKPIRKPAVGENAVEPTGAGDAFSSGFLGALFYGKNIEEALDWGLKNSASVIRKIGAIEGLLNYERISI